MIITLETVCPFCGRVSEVDVYEEDYYAWNSGNKLVQDAFPYLSADEREIGGLGIFMVKQTMDAVEYEYKDGSNILTLVKNL